MSEIKSTDMSSYKNYVMEMYEDTSVFTHEIYVQFFTWSHEQYLKLPKDSQKTIKEALAGFDIDDELLGYWPKGKEAWNDFKEYVSTKAHRLLYALEKPHAFDLIFSVNTPEKQVIRWEDQIIFPRYKSVFMRKPRERVTIDEIIGVYGFANWHD